MSVTPQKTGPLPSHSAWLPAVARPPHDPRRLPLGPIPGWHAQRLDGVRPDGDGALVLAPPPAAEPLIADPGGTLGGLTLPPNAVVAGAELLLLDRAAGSLPRLDRCACRLVVLPCIGGIGAGPRQVRDPGAIALCRDWLLVADAGNARVSVFGIAGWALRAHWAPPPDATAQPWRPVSVVAVGPEVLVADPDNGAIHRFARSGRWIGLFDGLGAVSRLVLGSSGRLYVLRGPALPALILDPASGAVLGESTLAHEIADDFVPPPVRLLVDGRMELSGLCGNGSAALWIDSEGHSIPTPVVPAPALLTAGSYLSQALDSRLYRCLWDRLALDCDLPLGARIRVLTYSAETPLSLAELDTLPAAAWSTDVTLSSGAPTAPLIDCLLRAAPGRFLWLRLVLIGDGAVSPRIRGLTLDFPRISLRRYLPRIFGEEPESADFTDRLLAVLDRGQREIEGEIDHLARLFDPLSAPAEPARRDFLTWLASWIGVTLDRQLPLATRRRLLKQAGRLFACRGTPTGLRQMLSIPLGIDRPPAERGCAQLPGCGPCTTRKAPAWQPPQLILEHFKLRRWLLLGSARLGDDAMLWGQSIVNRSQLSGPVTAGNARLGVTQLKTSQDPLRDPFHVYAHRFTLFLPGWLARRSGLKRALERLVAAEKPAHTQATILWVEPRMRIGVQAVIGLDAVIGCWPVGVALADANGEGSLLGRATVLGAAAGTGSGMRVGRGLAVR